MPEQFTDRFITPENLGEIISKPPSRATRWRWEKAGRFPRRVQLNGQHHAYLESELRAWAAARVAARDAGR